MPLHLSAVQHQGPLMVLAADSDSTGGLAGSPWAMPAFFFGWIGVGVVLALVLVRRGHDARITVVVGAGLGPLMALKLSRTIREQEAEAPPLVLRPGADHGGQLNVLVLVQKAGSPLDYVLSEVHSLRDELGFVTVAQAVTYETLEGDVDDDVIRSADSELYDTAMQLGVPDAELALVPGRSDHVAERLGHERGLDVVLVVDARTSLAGRRII